MEAAAAAAEIAASEALENFRNNICDQESDGYPSSLGSYSHSLSSSSYSFCPNSFSSSKSTSSNSKSIDSKLNTDAVRRAEYYNISDNIIDELEHWYDDKIAGEQE